MIQDTFDIYFNPLLLEKLETTNPPFSSSSACNSICALFFPVKMFEAGVQSWRTEGRFSHGASKTDATRQYWGESPLQILQDLRQHAKHRHSAISFVCKKPRFIHIAT